MDSGHCPNDASAVTGFHPRHVVSIPYPGRGHINPMINLCRLLAGRDLTITIIFTEEWLDLINSESKSHQLPSNIHLRSIPNVLPSEHTRGNNYTEFFEAVLTKMTEPVQRLLDELDQPADVVVADALLPWVVHICKQRNAPAVSLWTESVSVFFALYTFDRLDASGQLPADFSENIALAYLPNATTTRIADLLPNATELDLMRAFARKYYWYHTAHSLLTTSFDELERSVIDKIRSEFAVPIYQVGPLIPHTLLFSPSPKASKADSSYLEWLDDQPKCTVLYVSLGSFLSISCCQMEEIAMGLVESGVRFLWVVRDKLQCIDKVDQNDTGFVVPWCDQLRVLCHSSVGGFLTHCGWNSTLEAVYAGVPMITYPLFWDQQPNSKLVVEDWRIGLKLKEKEESMSRELIVKQVRKLMDFGDEENKGMRERAKKMKEMCRDALKVGGSSPQSLDEFVQQISERN